MVRFGKLGRQLISGANKTTKELGKAFEKYDNWEEARTRRTIKKQTGNLKKLRLEAKIAREKAKIKKYRPKDTLALSDW